MRKSFSESSVRFFLASYNSRDIFPVVLTIISSPFKLSSIISIAFSLVNELVFFAGLVALYDSKVPFLIKRAHGFPCFFESLLNRKISDSTFSPDISADSTTYGIDRASSSASVILPCFLCWGSSTTPGSPRHPMISNIGMAYTSLSASDISGFMALPNPEFCIYTPAAPPVAR